MHILWNNFRWCAPAPVLAQQTSRYKFVNKKLALFLSLAEMRSWRASHVTYAQRPIGRAIYILGRWRLGEQGRSHVVCVEIVDKCFDSRFCATRLRVGQPLPCRWTVSIGRSDERWLTLNRRIVGFPESSRTARHFTRSSRVWKWTFAVGGAGLFVDPTESGLCNVAEISV